MDTLPSFGQWLKQRLKALDLTQAVLAAAVGCATMTIQKIEAEERRPSKQLAEHLAQALVVPPVQQRIFVRVARSELGPERLNDLVELPNGRAQRNTDQLKLSAEPATAVPGRTRTLPVQRNPLLGRERELAQLCNLMLRDDVGLVTLTGPGGTGKTRLAIALATGL